MKVFLADDRVPSFSQFGPGLVIGYSTTVSHAVDQSRFGSLQFLPEEVLVQGQPFSCFVIARPEELADRWAIIQDLISVVRSAT